MKDTVFQQFLKPINNRIMQECVKKFQSDYYYESFKTQEHLQTMVYAHLNEIKSLRALELALNSQKIGVKSKIKRSTVSDANAKRPAECFFWLVNYLMGLLPKRRNKELNKFIKILDSSPIKLQGRGYDDWVKPHATAHWQGLKLHVEYDLSQQSPTNIKTSFANYNDSSMGQRWPIMPNTIYIFDKGYCDFNWWWSIRQKGAYFVTRLKRNTAILMQSRKKGCSKKILEDGTYKLKNKHPRGGKKNLYRDELRRISVARKGKDPLILVTNLHDVSAETIAELYKSRWEVELFFKWIKQNLKIKKFLGRSLNAVKIQLATAIITYLLAQLFKKCFKKSLTLSLKLVWVKYNLHSMMKCYQKYKPPEYIIHRRPVYL